ncbi:hybrid sensor histidine kinase/response regulator [Halovenus sp. HT40]|uniref:hybrid sensor histidine kinase/response regulator n=1 Tax=Halovenus sp. HT40 TaxID=3126691 RepID=UPI00300F4874
MNVLSDTVHVLHVDDEPDFAEMAATFLERENEQFVVETATAASEALDYVTENHVDCIISDYDMPDQNGIEFLEAVREECPGLPFILFTGKGSEEIASDAISAGVTDYLQKESGTSQYAVLANRIQNAVEAFTAQRERQRHLDAIETSQEGIAILDDGRFRYVNEAYADLYGYDPEEMIGEHWELIYPDEDVPRGYNEIIPEVKETGNWQGKTTGLRADGSTFIEDHALSMTDSGELVCTVRDITDREQQRKQLEETTARLELAVEGANIGVWDWDTRTDDVQFNEKWAEMLGYSLDEIDPTLDTWEQRVHPDDFDDAMETLQAHLDGETEYYDSEYRMQTAAGEWKWIRDIGRVVERDEAGDPARAVGIHLDIDERKQREQELEQEKQRLEEFTGVVSHDLRNPLKVASGRIELARTECDSDHLDDAEAALGRMEELLDDLLRLARSGDQIDEVVSIDLETITEDCWRNVETPEATVVAATQRSIRGDRSRVSQLFENLFRNAVEHGSTNPDSQAWENAGSEASEDAVEHGSTSPDSHTRQDAGSEASEPSVADAPEDAAEHGESDVTVTVGELDDGFYVEDDGPGIPDEHREDVFDTGYSTSTDGTGFGLSIVNQVVNAHDWTIEVTDGSDGGARFEITGVEFDS